MILCNRERSYSTKLTVCEREEIAKAISTPNTIKFVSGLNIAINVLALIASLLLFRHTQYNLIVFIVAFILTDALLLVLDHFVFIVLPHWRTMHLSLNAAQKRLEKVKQKRDEIVGKIALYKTRHCNDCYRSCSTCYRHLVGYKVVLDNFIEDEERWVNKELDQIKEQEVKTEKRQGKDYTDKREYLEDMQEKLDYYVSKHDMVILSPVLESVNLLVDTIERKPIGYGLISNTLYIYLDELSIIVDKLIGLDRDQQEEYIKDVTKIAIALSNNINTLIDRIKNLETEDIEVGIAVLLQELARKEDNDV